MQGMQKGARTDAVHGKQDFVGQAESGPQQLNWIIEIFQGTLRDRTSGAVPYKLRKSFV